MFPSIVRTLALLLSLPALATPALAQSRNLTACLARSSPETEVAACTAALGESGVKPATRAVILNDRGVAYWKLKRYMQAIVDLDESISLNPRDATSFYNRAEVHRARGDNERAIADYSKAMAMKSFSHPYNGRGNSYRNLGRYDQAIADYNAAIRISPGAAVIYANRGDTYVLMKQYDKAIADYDVSLKRDSNLTRSYFGRGEAYLGKGDARRAATEFRAVLAREPDDLKAQAMLAQADAQLLPASAPGTIAVTAPNAAVSGQRRVALVIGNSDYVAGKLVNPANDAADVGAKLKAMGFDVITGLDLSKKGFADALARFDAAAHDAEAALVYYSGHAMQINGENWLLPVDTRVGSVFEAQQSSMSLQEVLRSLETRAKTTLVFLDACRNNPFSERLSQVARAENRAIVVTSGLARLQVSTPNTLVVFATQPNDVAADGEGRNSPFTQALLANVATPGVEVETLMKRVTADVKTLTADKQRPERLSGLTTEFYFVAAK